MMDIHVQPCILLLGAYSERQLVTTIVMDAL
jgi:hypothetical protein